MGGGAKGWEAKWGMIHRVHTFQCQNRTYTSKLIPDGRVTNSDRPGVDCHVDL